MGSYEISTFGTYNSPDTVTYSISAVAAGGSVTSLKYSELVSRISDERVRRTQTSYSLSLVNPIGKAEFNSMLTNLNVKGHVAWDRYDGYGKDTSGSPNTIAKSSAYQYYGQSSEPSGIPANVDTGTAITASTVNDLITAIKNAGTVCSCNCNYCTCNCNYCTCNCNYSCTCNCNYSDERLKENITLIGTQGDLNVYSYTYLWNKAKTYIGVLAQEVLQTKYASAVMTDTNGFYYVDYSKLPVEFKEA